MIEAPRHDLDEAIDRVAAKMVAIDDDAGALQAVMSRLPERKSRPWFLRVPAQVTAAAALVVMAFLWARPIDRPAISAAVSPVATTAPPLVTARRVVPASRRPDARLPAPGFRLPAPGPRIPAVAIDRSDHEFSLPPVDAVEAIELSAITMPAFGPVAIEALAPLVLTDLPLASDSSSPREH